MEQPMYPIESRVRPEQLEPHVLEFEEPVVTELLVGVELREVDSVPLCRS
jgi:hypothetical protein